MYTENENNVFALTVQFVVTLHQENVITSFILCNITIHFVVLQDHAAGQYIYSFVPGGESLG